MNSTLRAVLICSVLGTIGLFGIAWLAAEAGGVQLTIHGWIAIGLGTALSLALSGVLFGLSFYSARSGHDDEVNND